MKTVLIKTGIADAASREWSIRLKDSLNLSALNSLFSNVEVNEIGSLDDMAIGLWSLDDSLAVKLIDLSIPKISSAFNNDIIKFSDINHIIYFVLGFAPKFLRRSEPSQDQKQIAYKLADGINSRSIAQFISQSRRRDGQSYADLINFLDEVMPEKAKQIAHLIDLNALDDTSKGLWGNLPHELLCMIAALATGDDHKISRLWINRHANELVSLHPLLVAIAPESTTAIRQGCNLDFALGDLANWDLATLAIRTHISTPLLDKT
jgi:hypothetical protein